MCCRRRWLLFFLIVLAIVDLQVSAIGVTTGAEEKRQERGNVGPDLSEAASAKEIEDLKAKLKIVEDLLKKKEMALQDKAKRIRHLENELKSSQAALRKVESKAAKRTRDIAKAYEAWFPPWASGRIAQFQDLATSHWVAHGEPILKLVQEKVSQNVEVVHNLAQPHIESIKMKWLPSLRKRLVQISATTGPLVAKLNNMVTNASSCAKEYISPHLKKAQEVIGPYTQLVTAKSSPHVAKALKFFRPYSTWFWKTISPYARKVHRVYKRSLRFAKNYHYQLQRSIKTMIYRHEYSAKFANKEFIWFLASTILLLPAVVFVITLSSHFRGKKISQPTSKSGSSNTATSHKRHRRAKQADK